MCILSVFILKYIVWYTNVLKKRRDVGEGIGGGILCLWL